MQVLHSLSYSADVNSFDCSNTLAPTAVTITLKDPCNNANSSCTANVTVVETIPPVAVCANITISLDATGSYSLTPADSTIIVSSTSDNCNYFVTTFSQEDFRLWTSRGKLSNGNLH